MLRGRASARDGAAGARGEMGVRRHGEAATRSKRQRPRVGPRDEAGRKVGGDDEVQPSSAGHGGRRPRGAVGRRGGSGPERGAWDVDGQ